MVGKPTLPRDAEDRPDVHGSSTTTPGLTPVDEEREASMADEGGASGAAAEAEQRPPDERVPEPEPGKRRRHSD